MRNLKKVLSLALALVMLLGMMMVGAGAADTGFEDDGTIKDGFKTAAAVTKALGVMEGSNGNLNPTGKIVRAEAYILALRVDGSNANTLAANWPVNEKPFNDVSTGKWYAHYIAYGKAMGDLKGTNGYYNPDKNVTAVEYAILLLKRLGFDSERYVGDMWAANAITDGVNTKLFDGLGSMNYQTHELTREEACQMAFNAITKYSPSGSGGWVLMDGDNRAATYANVTFPTLNDAVMAKLAAGGGANSWTVKEAPAEDTLAKKVFKLASSTTSDALGRPVTQWTIDGEKACVTNDAGAPYKTYTEAVEDLNKGDLKDYTYASGLKYLENGVEKTAIASAADIEARTGNGVIVEVYATGKQVTGVVVIKKQVAKLAADPVVAANGNITISSLGMAGVKPENVDGDVSDLAKGDVVLFVKDAKNVWHIEKAEIVTGTVSGNHSDKGALIDGEYYLATALAGKGITPYAKGSVTDDKEYNFYLDNGGFIVYAEAVSDGTASASNYAVVLKTSWVKTTGTGTIGEKTSAYLQAQILKTDGTTEIVTVASIDGATPVKAGAKLVDDLGHTTSQYAKSDATLSNVKDNDGKLKTGTSVAADTVTAKDQFTAVADTATGDVKALYVGVEDGAGKPSDKAPAYSFYTFTVNSKGAYNLSTSATGTDTLAVLAGNHDLENGKVKFDGTNIGNANTVFLYEITSGNDVEYKVYTGIADAPTVDYDDSNNKFTNHNGKNAIVKNSAGVAKLVFVRTTGTTNDSQDIVYITSKKFTQLNTNPATFIYSALVNGEAKNITIDTRLADNTAVGFHAVTSVSDKGVYTLADAKTTTKTGIKSNEGGTLVVSDGTAYTYEADAPAWYYDGKDCVETTVAALALDATDEVLVTGPDGTAKAVYVIAQDSKAGGLTLKVTTGDTTDVAITSNNADDATKDILKGKITVAQAAANKTASGKTVIVTAANGVTGMTYTVGIDGAGTDIEATAAAATYTLVAGDASKELTVTVIATDTYSGVVDTYTFTIAVGALTPA